MTPQEAAADLPEYMAVVAASGHRGYGTVHAGQPDRWDRRTACAPRGIRRGGQPVEVVLSDQPDITCRSCRRVMGRQLDAAVAALDAAEVQR